MEIQNDERFRELFIFYESKCSHEVKILVDSVKNGKASSMFSILLKNLDVASTTDSTLTEKLLHSLRFAYFLSFCLHYNSGIPMIEIISNWIDCSDREKTINSVNSMSTLVDFLSEKKIDISVLANYNAKNELIEYALDENKKSTGVLKRILIKKQNNQNELFPNNPSDKFPNKNKSQLPENKLSVSDWVIIFYYLDETGIKDGNKINRMEKFIKDNNILSPSDSLTTKGNFKKEYHEIENRINGKNNKKPLPPERIENILPFLKNNSKARKAAENDKEHLIDEIEENKRNTY